MTTVPISRKVGKPWRNQGIEKTGYDVAEWTPRGGGGPAPVWSSDALKDLVVNEETDEGSSLGWFKSQDFGRDDESPDRDFYAKPRFVDHLDSCALETVEQIYGRLIPAGATILDLMAGPDSHLGKASDPNLIVGLGLNKAELEANPILLEHVIHDINSDPRLPFPDNRFDVVINTVSVDYLNLPLEVFREVSRVFEARWIVYSGFFKQDVSTEGGQHLEEEH